MSESAYQNNHELQDNSYIFSYPVVLSICHNIRSNQDLRAMRCVNKRFNEIANSPSLVNLTRRQWKIVQQAANMNSEDFVSKITRSCSFQPLWK